MPAFFLKRLFKRTDRYTSQPVESDRPQFRPQLTDLEARDVPAVITVTNTSGNVNTSGSLPWAVQQANYFSAGFDNIRFNIPGSGPQIINITSTLYINSQMAIEGNTQPGFDGSRPLIAVHGSANVPSLFLLQNDPAQGTTSSSSTIQYLSMAFYTNNAVTILNGSQGNFIQNNWMGFYRDLGGNVSLNSAYFPEPTYYSAGIGIQSSFNTVRNNTINGVYNGVVMGEAIEGTWSGTQYKTNSVQLNMIGVDPTGTTSAGYGNSSDGIFLGAGARENFLGPTNVISGNGSACVELLAPSNIGNVVFASKIGTDVTGTVSIPNGELGILLANGASGNAIGGPFGGNVIAGNRLGGVALGTSTYPGASGNWVQYNIFNLNAGQTAVLGTQNVAISLESTAASNVVQGNVIAGHTSHGIIMRSTTGNFIQGNWIGRSSSGTFFANGGFGVALLSGASFNYVVQTSFGANTLGTVFVDPAAIGNVIS